MVVGEEVLYKLKDGYLRLTRRRITTLGYVTSTRRQRHGFSKAVSLISGI